MPKYSNSFIIIEPRQESKDSWRFLVQAHETFRISANRLLDSNYIYKRKRVSFVVRRPILKKNENNNILNYFPKITIIYEENNIAFKENLI
jgi:hypothetical protein